MKLLESSKRNKNGQGSWIEKLSCWPQGRADQTVTLSRLRAGREAGWLRFKKYCTVRPCLSPWWLIIRARRLTRSRCILLCPFSCDNRRLFSPTCRSRSWVPRCPPVGLYSPPLALWSGKYTVVGNVIVFQKQNTFSSINWNLHEFTFCSLRLDTTPISIPIQTAVLTPRCF